MRPLRLGQCRALNGFGGVRRSSCTSECSVGPNAWRFAGTRRSCAYWRFSIVDFEEGAAVVGGIDFLKFARVVGAKESR